MHGNSEMQKSTKPAQCLKKLTFTGVVGLRCTNARLDGQTLPLFLASASRNTLLYTEMVTTGAIIHGKVITWRTVKKNIR